MRYSPILCIFPLLYVSACSVMPTETGETLETVKAQNSTAESADEVKVPVADDLSSLAEPAKKQATPIMIMYSAEDCEYCQRLEEDLIKPMILSGELDRQVIFRKVMIDGIHAIKDFDGQPVDPEKFAYKRGVQVTPTLQFVDAEGNELVPKMVGYQGTELYAGYLNNAIGGSREKLENQ